MLLNGQRLSFIVALFATLTMVGCVDLPSDGPTPPDYRSSIKFFHAGRGRDTIAFPISTVTYKKTDSTITTVSIGGTDSVRTKTIYAQSYSISRYRRYDVDFNQTFGVYVDGVLKSTLAKNATTGYFDLPAGNRLITLQGDVNWVDSIRVTKVDTATTVYRDSIKGSTVTARLVFESTSSGSIITKIPQAGTVRLTVDSSRQTLETDKQYSMYFIGDTLALETKESNQVRFGFMRFYKSHERMLFQPTGPSTGAAVKFVNAYPNHGTVGVRRGTTDISTTLTFGGAVGSVITFSNNTLTDKFLVLAGGVVVDSVSLTMNKTGNYSIVMMDSSGTRVIKTYTH